MYQFQKIQFINYNLGKSITLFLVKNTKNYWRILTYFYFVSMFKRKILFLLIIYPFLFLTSQSYPKLTEKEKITYLLDELEKSKLIFIRNGDEYSAKDARDHMQKKLDYAGNRITTADQFITYIATKSSLSGKSYYVKYPDGKQTESAVYLRNLLSKLEEKK